MSWISFSFPGIANVQCAFTTRLGGVGTGPYASCNLSYDVGDDPSHVRENRKRITRLLGFKHVSELGQVHGTHMVFDPQPGDTGMVPLKTGDGQATARPDLALMIKTADCQPILLAHGSGRYVAALHCGWRGNRDLFPKNGVLRFCDHYGLHPRDIFAVRGPSLGPERSEFVHFEREWPSGFRSYFDPRFKTMDLWRLTRDQLLEAGLSAANIFGLDLCTFDETERFFSYRREKVSGRQAGFIWIDAPAGGMS